MTRQLDRGRGVLNLMIILSCFAFYAGYLIKTEAKILYLFDEFKALVEQGEGEIPIKADDLKLIEAIEMLDVVTDLTWSEEKDIVLDINSVIGMQGQHPELSDWLSDQQIDKDSRIQTEKLPKKFYKLFEDDEKTLTARRLSAQMKEKYYALKSVVGETGSVLDFYKADNPKINLYSLNIPLNASRALVVLVLLSGVLSLYLLSLLGSITYEIHHLDKREGTDLILFHPGRLSLVISFLWIFSPIMVALYNYLTITNIDFSYLVFTCSAAVVVLITYIKSIECRRSLFLKLSSL